MAIQSIRLSYPDIRPVTNIGFKPLKEGFFLERKKFVAHKTFNINNTNTGSFGIYVLAAQKGVTGLRMGSNVSINSTLYQSDPFKSINRDSFWKSLNTMFFSSTTEDTSSRQLILKESASVVSIPQYRYWDGIKPASLQITNSGYFYNDIFVGKDLGIIVSQSLLNNFTGSTIDSSSTGYVFYKHGLIVMNGTQSNSNSSPFLGDGNWDYTSHPFNFSYKSTREFQEYSILCEIGTGEFNVTTNTTSLISPSSSIRAGFTTSSNFTPYFTKIGLYNDDSQLLAVAKLSTPLRKSRTATFIVNVKFDID